MKSIRWVWKYLKKYEIRLSTSFALVFLCSLLNMVTPYMSGKIVDDVIMGGNTRLLTPLIGIMLGVTFIKSIITYTYRINFETISQGVMYNIRGEIYTKLQKQDFDFFDKTRTGDLMTRMTSDADMVRYFIAWVVFSSFDNASIFIFAVIIMLTINYKFTIVLLLLTPFTGYLAYKLAFTVRPTFVKIREQFSRLNSVVQENISGNRVVKAFTKEDYEIEKFTERNKEFRQSNIESARVWEKYLPALDFLGSLLSAVTILAGGIMVIGKQMTIGQLVTFNSLIFAINNPMRMVGWLVNDIQRFIASAEKIDRLLKEEPSVKNKPHAVKKDNIKGMVTFNNVSFRYGEEPILKNISFTALPGQTIAIIGPTGSGKSTIVNLICRFYDCSEGEVLVDGIDVRDMNIKELRGRIAIAMQDIFLFSDTIEGNIAYGVPDAPMDKVMWAADVADAKGFIEEFDEGFDTIIGERGVGLSGGQRQRIALARALLKNPSILILDDTTSSVDIETEHKIHNMLKSYYKNRTTFIIAHRVSAVKNADMILVIDKGTIVEQGNHNELISKKGYYYSIYTSQSGSFDNETIKRKVC